MNGTFFPFAGLLLGVFMASIVLFVDLAMNKVQGHQSLHRIEVCQALRLLESARHESETIARFVDSLTELLRKHKITSLKDAVYLDHLATDVDRSRQNAAVAELSGALLTSDSTSFAKLTNGLTTLNDPKANAEEDMSSYFQDLAQNFEQGLSADQFDWDNILLDLNTSFV
jgi:hypothetical protein